ncbi:MFS transporter [Phenylobacterium sp.]|jgi:MHS family alpha-ketoglutarate permease-like MFS transporter|uniref:MFS transporter n=1 Tax=Phenylobacterium sp. TaxID=1871053 RepID=UPI0037C6361B
MTQTAGLPANRLRSILAGSAGNLVESFDWFVYAAFGLYFSKVFFPEGDRTAQLLSTAAVFGVGFMARPLGAWLMGLYGDRVGRKTAMVLAVSLMCAGSLLIAVCPGEAEIGVAAPAILVFARILQGISMGGEYGVSATYLSEMASRKNRGFWSGVFYSTLIAGQLMAMGVLLVLTAVLTPEEMQAWGWRVPFFMGGGLAVAVFWLRRGMDETPSFHARTGPRATTIGLIRSHPREALTVIGLTAGGTLAYYTYTTYIQKFLVNTSGFTKDQANLIVAAGLAIFMLINPLMGALSDRVGRRAILMTFGVLGAALTWPMLSTLAATRDPWLAFGLVTSALVVLSAYSSVNAVVKAELFPTEVRALGVALPYSLANAVFGGTAEYVALAFKQAGAETWFFTYVTVVIAASLAVYVLMPDTRKASRIMED